MGLTEADVLWVGSFHFEDKKVLEISCLTLGTCLVLNCVLENGPDDVFYIRCIFVQFKKESPVK